MFSLNKIYFFSTEERLIAAKCVAMSLKDGQLTYHFWDIVQNRKLKIVK